MKQENEMSRRKCTAKKKVRQMQKLGRADKTYLQITLKKKNPNYTPTLEDTTQHGFYRRVEKNGREKNTCRRVLITSKTQSY